MPQTRRPEEEKKRIREKEYDDDGAFYRLFGQALMVTHNCEECMRRNRFYVYHYKRDKDIAIAAAKFINDHPNELAFNIDLMFRVFKSYKKDSVPQINS
jgi:hypothetical protein